MYVRPAWRRQGVGRRLTQEIIRVAAEIGYERIRLDTLAPMAPARRLYESLGFRQIEPYYHNPIEGAVFYELDVS
jgi:putative acetyltransferase